MRDRLRIRREQKESRYSRFELIGMEESLNSTNDREDERANESSAYINHGRVLETLIES